MEYQDYNDEYHRYKTDGYVKTVRDQRKNYDRIIGHFKLEERMNRDHINEQTYRKIQLGGKIRMLEKELHKMNQEDRTEINLMRQNEKARDLIQSANERDIIRSNIRYLKHNEHQLKEWIKEKQQKKSKLVIF